VTGQPAPEVGLLLPVTVNAESHKETVFLESVHGLHLAVALLAGQFLLNVSLMVEKDKLWNIVYLDPRRWSVGVVIFVLLLNPRKLFYDVVVTIQAFLHWRNSGKFGATYIGMAELALDILYTGVDPVAEWYGLLGTDVRGIIVKKVKEEHGAKCRKESQEQGPPVPFQGS
jgi:hypothetical protein